MGRQPLASITLLAAVCLAPALQSQRDISGTAGRGSIHGRVILHDSPDRTPEQIPVHLSQSNGPPITVSYTSGNGQFLFTNLPSGGFEVTINWPGYQRFAQVVSIHTGSTRIQMQAHLRPLEPRAEAGGGSQLVAVSEMLAPPAARRECEKGLEKLRKNDLAGAERHLKKAVALHPPYPRAWVELGQLYERTHRSNEALESFRHALSQDAKNRDALLSMARLLNDQNRPIEALRAAAQIEQLYPGDPRNHLEIARGLLGAGKIQEAELAARQLERQPHQQRPEVHLVLFNIFQVRQDKIHAAGELGAYLKEMEDSGVASTNPAIVRARETLAKLETEIAAKK